MREQEYIDKIDLALREYLSAPEIPAKLAEAMRYSVFAGGKRLRPLMLLEACHMLEGRMEAALPLGCAMEMIHTYSLIHDDLPCMDNDDFRRGKPTNHKVFGEGYAVLAGDGLLSYAFEIMAQAMLEWQPLCPAYGEAVHAVAFGAGVFGMVAGQVRDLENEHARLKDEETLAYIHRHKTGAMLRASLLAGGYAAGAAPEQIAALSRFGEEYGLLFQITDDILDVEGDFLNMGKTLGKDAAHDKLTYVTLYGLDKARALAGETAERAHEALGIFAGRAQYFHDLLDATLTRDH